MVQASEEACLLPDQWGGGKTRRVGELGKTLLMFPHPFIPGPGPPTSGALFALVSLWGMRVRREGERAKPAGEGSPGIPLGGSLVLLCDHSVPRSLLRLQAGILPCRAPQPSRAPPHMRAASTLQGPLCHTGSPRSPGPPSILQGPLHLCSSCVHEWRNWSGLGGVRV